MPQTERPDRRLAAIWFAEIVGFNDLASANEPAALEEVARLGEIAAALAATHGGQVVNRAGDGALAEFASTDAAVRAAIRLRDAYAESSRSAGAGCTLRIGVHVGEVVSGGAGDIQGDGVNIAVRLQEQAQPGEVVVSEDARYQLEGQPGYSFRGLGARKLKGREDHPVRVFSVVWTEAAAAGRASNRPAFTLDAAWTKARDARLVRVLAVYLSASFVILQLADILTFQLGLPDWFFPGALVLLLLGLPIITATAVLQAGMTRMTSPEPAGAPDPASAIRGLFTWRRAMLGGVAAFAVWGVVVSGFMGMRALGIGPMGSLIAAGVIEPGERILVADFHDRTGGDALGTAVTEAFRVDLSRSPILSVAPSTDVVAALGRMGHEAGIPLDPDLAREVALREGIKAFVTGEIHAVGSGYVLSAHLVSAADGVPVASFRETAAGDDALIPAIERLSRHLRERTGESLRTIRAGEPLERVTTASLPALRMYSEALRLGRSGAFAEGIPLLEDAIALDPGFAMAHRALAINFGNLQFARERRVEAFRQAYAHRHRLTEAERYITMASYYQNVAGDVERSLAANEGLLRLEPENRTALGSAAVAYRRLGRPAEAEPLFRRFIELDSSSVVTYFNLAGVQWEQGRADDAYLTLNELERRFPGSQWGAYLRARFESAAGDFDRAAATLTDGLAAAGVSPAWRAHLLLHLAEVRAATGRLEVAERHLLERAEIYDRIGDPGLARQALESPALMYAIGLGSPDIAADRLERALSRYPLAAPVADYPHHAMALAVAGRGDLARRSLEEYEAEVARGAAAFDAGYLALARGLIHLMEEQPGAALAEFRRAYAAPLPPCRSCVLPYLGRAHEAAGSPDSAAVYFERYLGNWDDHRWSADWVWLGQTLEWLATHHEAAGRPDRAAEHRTRLVELWKNADPVLQLRVDAARRSLAGLAGEEPGPGGQP